MLHHDLWRKPPSNTTPSLTLRTASPVRASNPPSRLALGSALPRCLPLGNRRRGKPRLVTNSPWTRFYSGVVRLPSSREHGATQLDDVGYAWRTGGSHARTI